MAPALKRSPRVAPETQLRTAFKRPYWGRAYSAFKAHIGRGGWQAASGLFLEKNGCIGAFSRPESKVTPWPLFATL